jgi:hypothetical protein
MTHLEQLRDGIQQLVDSDGHSDCFFKEKLNRIVEIGPKICEDEGMIAEVWVPAEVKKNMRLSADAFRTELDKLSIQKMSYEFVDYMVEWNAGKLVLEDLAFELKDGEPAKHIGVIHFHWFPLCKYDEWGGYNEM